MRYYDIEYAYGPGVVNDGNLADLIVGFPSRGERDAWVLRGSAYRGTGWREVITRWGAEHHAAHNAVKYSEHGEVCLAPWDSSRQREL